MRISKTSTEELEQMLTDAEDAGNFDLAEQVEFELEARDLDQHDPHFGA